MTAVIRPQAPKIDVQIVESSERPDGIGEPKVRQIAPALANAVCPLTKKRVREVPIRLSRPSLRERLAARSSRPY